MKQPAVSTVIVGATSTEQLEHNLDSVELPLDSSALEELDTLSHSFRNGEPFALYRLS
ncbi:Aldo/keto reductase family protein [compost metagenome]